MQIDTTGGAETPEQIAYGLDEAAQAATSTATSTTKLGLKKRKMINRYMPFYILPFFQAKLR